MVFFDPTTVPRDPKNQLIDSGLYEVTISNVKPKQGEKGAGCLVVFKVNNHHAFKNREVVDYFNLDHMSEEATRIGRSQFVKMLDCIDMGNKPLQYAESIIGKTLKVDIGTAPDHKNNTESKNVIKKYFKCEKDIPDFGNNATTVTHSPF